MLLLPTQLALAVGVLFGQGCTSAVCVRLMRATNACSVHSFAVWPVLRARQPRRVHVWQLHRNTKTGNVMPCVFTLVGYGGCCPHSWCCWAWEVERLLLIRSRRQVREPPFHVAVVATCMGRSHSTRA